MNPLTGFFKYVNQILIELWRCYWKIKFSKLNDYHLLITNHWQLLNSLLYKVADKHILKKKKLKLKCNIGLQTIYSKI